MQTLSVLDSVFHKFHLIIKFLSECGKGPKKTFAPPSQKLHSLMCYSPNPPKEETLEISSPKARSEKKEEKATTENGPSGGQENKGKPQDKQAVKKEKERASLTNAEFEEIVQIVLRKSLQECLGMAYSERRRFQLDKLLSEGERVMAPHILEISATEEAGVTSVIKRSKPGQPDPAPSEKKFNRSSLSKGKKGARKYMFCFVFPEDEKMEKAQSGHEQRQKDQLKKPIQDDSQTRNQQKGEGGGFGQCLVWVQCSSPNCEKWRRLCGNIDPSVLPDNWSCDQNTDFSLMGFFPSLHSFSLLPDLRYNRCDIPEESWTGRESDVAYASYIPGSIIWAKQYGYPWWPGMVESDPDLGEYFLFASHLDSLPSKYHVTFFGETVSRAWIPVNMLKNFQELSLELAGVGKLCWEEVPCLTKCAKKKCRNKDCNQKLGAALMMAQEAEQISIQERVNLFGFRSRYNGSDSSGEGKDLSLSGANSPDSCMEKEEEESELEAEELEKEEEKKDPTLPSPKSAKIQTKKPKARAKKDDFLEEPGYEEKHNKKKVQNEKSDLDLEQLLEDVGREPEQLEGPRCGDDPGEFTLAFFEE
ncbi:hypothetical protein GH733_017977 [Mirounga leonina]|nr:hypothetical protein GH733_017977 [Mirounga leonina]